jgi:hypothetical protein
VLPLSRVSAHPDDFTEPHTLPLSTEGFGSLLGGGGGGGKRSLEVQVFMSTRGQLAAMAAAGGAAVSVLAATWNVGNALPPPPGELAASWLRGTAGEGRHHLVAVAAQECSYLRQARASRASTTTPSATPAGPLSLEHGAAAAAVNGNGASADLAPAPSVGATQAAAAAGAHVAADGGAEEEDEDDLEMERPAGAGAGGEAGGGAPQGRARMSRAKSIKGKITSTIDSATDWVRGGVWGGSWGSQGRGRGPAAGRRAVASASLCCLPTQFLHTPTPRSARTAPPAQETHIGAALGPKYWLVGSRHMFQTRILLFARMDVVPFIRE